MALDPEKQNPDGTWKKGVSGNPGGKPSRANFTKLLNDLFTDELVAYVLFCKAYGINTNVNINKDIIKLIEHPDVKKKFRKYIRKLKPNGKLDARVGESKLSGREQVDILKWVKEFEYGKATQQIKAEVETKQVNIIIDLPDNINKEDF